jgi:hypothetical protein
MTKYWCGTCGRAVHWTVTECKSCTQWWHDNPPPGEEEFDDNVALGDDAADALPPLPQVLERDT